MKLQAIITIEIDADDFVEAADHQRRIEALMQHLRDPYPDAGLVFKERRAARRGPPAANLQSRPLPRPSGKLRNYVD
ncbi:hypothetical protein N0B44_21170 [Roseibacterium beibuensis]|uniref:hypothetical protein n=1 Tax=[Roseibacterium] beibuensis TaxID=1193142 RepID=UPI00217D14C5|nr:hypothetical protein [Roseibacterium beibuensis]MCS6625427.1 hypothetical protein [Roseibacterium beibuensis]